MKADISRPSVFMATLFAILLCAITVFASPAKSATIDVTANATDTLDGANAQCSLREAIQNINDGATTYADCAPTGAYGASDTINIPAGLYTIAIATTNEDLNADGDFDINKSVSIVGAGAGSTIINGGGIDRVFHITGAYAVSIAGVTIQNGNTAGAGGGIYNDSGTLSVTDSTISGNSAPSGGGIWNYLGGTLTVTDSTISGNSAANYGGGVCNHWGGTANVTNSTISGNSAAFSGGILNSDTLTVTSSTISGNTGARGGGIDNDDTLTVTNSTISGNTATTVDGGGGIKNGQWGTATVTNSTIVRNAANAGRGSGIFNGSIGTSKLIVANSIVADNGVGLDCVGGIPGDGWNIDSGGNIDSDTSCGTFTHNSSMIQGAGFGALANNGGPTQTHALLFGSAAIGTAPTCAGLTTDQRGTARPQGSACDIGAFEFDYLTLSTTVTGNGMVTSSTGVINYSGTSAQSLARGTSVTLTAAEDAGYTFTGWGGGACSGTATTCNVTLNAATNVTATFTAHTSNAANTIVIDPVTPATLYAGIDGAGVYKSLNSGGTWTATNILPANVRVKAIVIKPGDSTKLYAATYGNGVYKSVNISGDPANNGKDWTVCANTNLANLNVVSLTIDATGKLYAGTEAGVFVSENDCATWNAMNTGLPN